MESEVVIKLEKRLMGVMVEQESFRKASGKLQLDEAGSSAVINKAGWLLSCLHSPLPSVPV